MIWYMIYFFKTAIGLTPGGSCTVHIYTQTIHRTTQWTQIIHRTTQLTKWEECGPCELYPAICLTTEGKSRKTLSQGSRRVPVGTTATILLEGSRLRNLCLKILFVSQTGTQYVCSTVQYTNQSDPTQEHNTSAVECSTQTRSHTGTQYVCSTVQYTNQIPHRNTERLQYSTEHTPDS
jgi:hypothetical protein